MTKDKVSRKGAVIGIDLGGTKLSGALLSKEGEIIHKTETLLGDKGGADAGSLLVQQVHELELFAKDKHYRIDSIGICVPGICMQNNRTVWAPNIPGWEAYPLYEEVRDGLHNPAIPVSIESDRNCYILGEIWKGSAQGSNNAIFMAVGTGIGIGVVANGQIINGMNGIAGAIGWMALDRPFLSDYKQCGQFEFHASGAGIANSAENLINQGYKSEYLVSGEITTRDVFSAYTKNDQVAVKVVERCIEYWGMVVANLVSIFNPEIIILGGGVFGPAIQFLDRIAEEAVKWAQPISIKQVKLEASSLKGDMGILGAAYISIRNELKL